MTKTKLVLVAGLGACIAISVGCSSKVGEHSAVESSGDGKGTAPAAAVAKQADKALVRFINGTVDTKDLSFGDAPAFTGTKKFDVTEYKELPAERHEFKLLASQGQGAPLASNSEGLSGGKHYTILAVTAKDGTTTLDAVNDDLVPPSPGMAKIRVINLAPTMENIDLYAGAKKSALISGAGLDHPTGYSDVAPSEASLYFRNSMSKKNSIPVKDLTLEAGKLYTILVFEDTKGKPKVKTIKDEFTSAPDGTKS